MWRNQLRLHLSHLLMHCYFVVLVRVNIFHGMNSLPALSLCVSKALDVLTFLMKRNVLSNNVHLDRKSVV